MAQWIDPEPGIAVAAEPPPAEVTAVHGELAAGVLRGLRAQCAAAAATPAGALVAALHDVLAETDLAWLTGNRPLPPLSYRAVHRLTGLPELVGCFATSHPVDLAGGNPTFAERARSVPDRIEAREPVPCAVELALAIDEPAPGLVPPDPPTTVLSSGILSVATVRVVRHDGTLRTHWTLPAGVDAGRAAALDERYRDRLRRYATDEAAWWDGVDHFNNTHGLPS